jgi:hypothetical protein
MGMFILRKYDKNTGVAQDQPVGASLLAIALDLQHCSWLTYRHREQARSHRVRAVSAVLAARLSLFWVISVKVPQWNKNPGRY